MFWVVQSNLHREEGHARLIAALRRAGSQFAEVQVLPFIDKLVPADVDVVGQDVESLPSLMLPLSVTRAPVFVMGSYKLARIARGCPWTGPGAFLEGLKYTEWAEGWGHEHLLNPHAQVMPFCAAHLARVGREVFVRPVADSKEFAGRVFSRGAFYRWIKEAEQEGSQHVPPDTEVLVAPVVRDIHSETRFWVVDGNVVTWSLYKRGGKPFQSEDVDPSVVSFARALAMRWCPSPAFVVDVAVTDDGPKVVEANCLSAAGFYAGDMQKLVFALEDYFNGRKPGSGPIDKVYMEIGIGIGNLAGVTKLELHVERDDGKFPYKPEQLSIEPFPHVDTKGFIERMSLPKSCVICGKEVCAHLSLEEELMRLEEQPMPIGQRYVESARMFEAMGVAAQDVGQGEEEGQVFWLPGSVAVMNLEGITKLEITHDPADVVVQEGEPIVFQEMKLPAGFEGFQKEMEEHRARLFAQQFQQEFLDVGPVCATCSHPVEYHQHGQEKRMGYCKGMRTECECEGFYLPPEVP